MKHSSQVQGPLNQLVYGFCTPVVNYRRRGQLRQSSLPQGSPSTTAPNAALNLTVPDFVRASNVTEYLCAFCFPHQPIYCSGITITVRETIVPVSIGRLLVKGNSSISVVQLFTCDIFLLNRSIMFVNLGSKICFSNFYE